MNFWPWNSKARTAKRDELTEAIRSQRETAGELLDLLQEARVRNMIQGLLPQRRNTAHDRPE